MPLFQIKRLSRRLMQTSLRVRDDANYTYFHRDTPVSRNAELIEAALWVCALVLGVCAISLWTPSRTGFDPAVLPLKLPIAIALLAAAARLGQAAFRGLRIDVRIDRVAGMLQCHRSNAGGTRRKLFECPLELVKSFHIVRGHGPHGASHFYARLTDGRDAIYLGSDDAHKLERLLDRLRARDLHRAASLGRGLTGLAHLGARAPDAA